MIPCCLTKYLSKVRPDHVWKKKLSHKKKQKKNTKQYTRPFWVREFFGSLWSSSCWVLHLAGCFFRCAEKPGRCLLGIFVGKVWQKNIIPGPWKTCEKTQIFSKYQLVRRISSMNKFGGEKSMTFNQWKNYPKTNKLPASSLFFTRPKALCHFSHASRSLSAEVPEVLVSPVPRNKKRSPEKLSGIPDGVDTNLIQLNDMNGGFSLPKSSLACLLHSRYFHHRQHYILHGLLMTCRSSHEPSPQSGFLHQKCIINWVIQNMIQKLPHLPAQSFRASLGGSMGVQDLNIRNIVFTTSTKVDG